jgi:hypothetical protein
MSSIEQAVEPKKKNPLVIVATLICGLAAMVLGGVQMTRGLSEIFGTGNTAEIKKHLDESDLAIDEANKFNLAAAPEFASLMQDVDSLGLKAFREQKQEAAQQVSDQFGKAAAEFHNAAKKLHEAAELSTKDKFKSYVASKTLAYDSAAQVCEQNQEIIRLVLDKAFDKLEDVLPKMQEVAARRDAAQKVTSEATVEADKIGKELIDSPKS